MRLLASLLMLIADACHGLLTAMINYAGGQRMSA
jgi:hypothetical protein